MKPFAAQVFAGLTFLTLASVSASASQVDIVIDKTTQHMTVSVDGVPQYDWLVSTAGRGYNTPSGHFHIFRLEKDHFSQEWDNAPMPNSMFFTGIGHAIHGSFHVKTLGTAVSHGCVRLLPANAEILYALIEKSGFKNNSVTIKGGFFDSEPQLTTEQTFHMQPNQFGHGGSNLPGVDEQANAGGPFWWLTHPQPARQVAAPEWTKPKKAAMVKPVAKAALKPKPVADNSAAPAHKKGKKQKAVKSHNFFEFLKAQQEG